MGRGKQSVVPQKGTTLTQLFRRLPAEDGNGPHSMMFAGALPKTAWYEEFVQGEDDSSHMFESVPDSAFVDVSSQYEGLQDEETTDLLDRTLTFVSLLPPNEDSRSSVLTAASTSTAPAAAAPAAAAAAPLPSLPSPASLGGSPHSNGAARKLKPNPYLNLSKLKRSQSLSGVLKAGDDGPEPKKQRAEETEGAATAVANGFASHHEPESSSKHEQDKSHIQGDRHCAGPESRPASSGSPTAAAATAAAATTTLIVASSRSRCLVIGPSPQKNLAKSFEESAAESTSPSQAPCASQSQKGPVEQKYEVCLKPRRAQFRNLEFKVGDTFVCSIPKKKKSKRAKGRTEDDECVVLTILGFVVGKDRAVVEERLELKDTFLGANSDSATNQAWINRYGSAYLAGGKKLWPLRFFTRKIESVPTSTIHYTGLDKGDNRNFVYSFYPVRDTDVRERVLPRKPVALELFAGGGGMSLGLKDAGFDVKYAVEKNFVFAHTLARNFDRMNVNCKVYNEDVLHFLDKVRNNVPKYPREGDVDHIHASSPCQGFSRANRNGGQDDTPNNELSRTFVAAIKLLRPRTASFENVRGMLDRHVSYVHEMLRDLLLEGYQVRLCLLKSSDYSVPQTRRRLFILASQQGCLLPSKPTTTSKLTVVDALHDLEDVRPMPGSGTVKLPDGKWISHHNSEGTEVKSDPQYLSQFNHGYVSAVMTLKPIKHYSSTLNRLLTPRERARLQTFPDDYEFSGTVKEVKVQIGNAVPCNMAQCVGRSLMECHTKEPMLSNPN